jgi:hypothetical protein
LTAGCDPVKHESQLNVGHYSTIRDQHRIADTLVYGMTIPTLERTENDPVRRARLFVTSYVGGHGRTRFARDLADAGQPLVANVAVDPSGLGKILLCPARLQVRRRFQLEN